jgi:hypothetical protein
VLELREGSEWSYKEIAHHEGVEVSTIETLVWRARQALKREFDAGTGSGRKYAVTDQVTMRPALRRDRGTRRRGNRTTVPSKTSRFHHRRACKLATPVQVSSGEGRTSTRGLR